MEKEKAKRFKRNGYTDRDCPWCDQHKLGVVIFKKRVKFYCIGKCPYVASWPKQSTSIADRRILYGSNPKNHYYQIGQVKFNT